MVGASHSIRVFLIFLIFLNFIFFILDIYYIFRKIPHLTPARQIEIFAVE